MHLHDCPSNARHATHRDPSATLDLNKLEPRPEDEEPSIDSRHVINIGRDDRNPMDDSKRRRSRCRSNNRLQPLAHTKRAQKRNARSNSYAYLGPANAPLNDVLSDVLEFIPSSPFRLRVSIMNYL